MKKKLFSVILAGILSIGLTVTSFADNVNVIVNGNPLKSEVPAQTINGRTLVPLATIFKELGAEVSWNQQEQKITASNNDTVIELKINNNLAYVNGKVTTLDVAPITQHGRTLVPLSFVSTALGADVVWNDNTKTASITTADSITQQKTQTYKVTKVIDGDTIKVMYNNKEESVRMIGIDTPESVHPDATKNVAAGKTASEFTTNALLGKEVELEFDVEQRDRYQRLLAYVYVDGKMFNKTLLEEGYAIIATYPPNVKYVEDFKAISNKTNPIISTVPIIENTIKESPSTSTGSSTIQGAYVGSTNSDKYHYPSCKWAKKIEPGHIVNFSTISEASSNGYVACKVCYPK